MALTQAEQDARTRAAAYNGNRYDATTNPPGLAGEGYKTNWPQGLNDTAILAAAVAREVEAAADSANDAANSQALAETSLSDVLSETARLLMPSGDEPSQRDDGAPLQAGDLYFNTALQAAFLFDGAAWAALAIDPGQFATRTLENVLDEDFKEKAEALGVGGANVAFISACRYEF